MPRPGYSGDRFVSEPCSELPVGCLCIAVMMRYPFSVNVPDDVIVGIRWSLAAIWCVYDDTSQLLTNQHRSPQGRNVVPNQMRPFC